MKKSINFRWKTLVIDAKSLEVFSRRIWWEVLLEGSSKKFMPGIPHYTRGGVSKWESLEWKGILSKQHSVRNNYFRKTKANTKLLLYFMHYQYSHSPKLYDLIYLLFPMASNNVA